MTNNNYEKDLFQHYSITFYWYRLGEENEKAHSGCVGSADVSVRGQFNGEDQIFSIPHISLQQVGMAVQIVDLNAVDRTRQEIWDLTNTDRVLITVQWPAPGNCVEIGLKAHSRFLCFCRPTKLMATCCILSRRKLPAAGPIAVYTCCAVSPSCRPTVLCLHGETRPN